MGLPSICKNILEERVCSIMLKEPSYRSHLVYKESGPSQQTISSFLEQLIE